MLGIPISPILRVKGQPKFSCPPSIPNANLVQVIIQFHIISVPNQQYGYCLNKNHQKLWK